jgi:hypothetical protein
MARRESLTLGGIFAKFDKSFGLSGKDYGKVDGTRTKEDIEESEEKTLGTSFYRGNVVSGFVQL